MEARQVFVDGREIEIPSPVVFVFDCALLEGIEFVLEGFCQQGGQIVLDQNVCVEVEKFVVEMDVLVVVNMEAGAGRFLNGLERKGVCLYRNLDEFRNRLDVLLKGGAR